MRRILLLAAILLAGARHSQAGGWAETFSLASGSVEVTNAQANSSWAPVSVMMAFITPASGTAEVSRVSQGYSFTLGRYVLSNATTIVWVPEAAYPFVYGDVLVIRCSETNGVVQLIRRGD